jgi:hypothetical protein
VRESGTGSGGGETRWTFKLVLAVIQGGIATRNSVLMSVCFGSVTQVLIIVFYCLALQRETRCLYM